MKNFVSSIKFQIKSNMVCYLLLATCYLFTACDYVSNPYLKQPTQPVVVNAANAVKVSDSTGIYGNFLVEDYTGEYCENCPSAAIELDTLIKTYGKRIIPVSVNTGGFAAPSTPLPTPYKSFNYTSGAGDTYGGQTAFNVQAFPNGFVNRQGAAAANPSPYPAWGGLVANAINNASVIKLKLSTQFDTLAHTLRVTANTTFLAALSGSYNLVVLLTEDSMKGPQNIGGTLNNSYYHRFVLHDAINSAWGDSLVSNGSAVNQTVTKTYSYNVATSYPNSNSQLAGLNTPSLPCNYKQCSVVAFVYDSKLTSPTRYVVLQSLALKIYK